MLDFWLEYSSLQKLFFVLALPATIILTVQFLLLLFGLGDGDSDMDGGGAELDDAFDGDLDADHVELSDVDAGLRIFTVRGLVTFFAVSGWSGLVLCLTNLPDALVLVLAAALGALSMVLMAMLVRSMMKLSYVPHVQLGSALGKQAQVYLTIPAARGGRGKITVELGGVLREMDAVTVGDAIPTGAIVRVVDLEERVTVVERL